MLAKVPCVFLERGLPANLAPIVPTLRVVTHPLTLRVTWLQSGRMAFPRGSVGTIRLIASKLPPTWLSTCGRELARESALRFVRARLARESGADRSRAPRGNASPDAPRHLAAEQRNGIPTRSGGMIWLIASKLPSIFRIQLNLVR